MRRLAGCAFRPQLSLRASNRYRKSRALAPIWTVPQAIRHQATAPSQDEMPRRYEEHYQGYGIGSHNARLQIVGCADGSWKEMHCCAVVATGCKSAVGCPSRPQRAPRRMGTSTCMDLIPASIVKRSRLLSAHDVNDRGWIVGIATQSYGTADPRGVLATR